MHNRRSYSRIQSLEEAELWAILWAVESMKSLRLDNIIFESSFAHARRVLYNGDGQVCAPKSSRVSYSIRSQLHLLRGWSLNHILPARNSIALRIAESVTSDHRYQSYIARNGPSWLQHAIAGEA
ncbi:hypothetical protein Bca101_006146 [Brassica carinata]